MALDYSKLSDEELDAIARGDYSKLSDATLQALSETPTPKPTVTSDTSAPVKTPAEQKEQDIADRNELLGAGAVGLGAAGAGAAYYKYGPGVQVAKSLIKNAGPIAEGAVNIFKNMAAAQPAPTAPTAPTAPVAPATSPILDASGRPMVRTPVPAPTAPVAQGPLPQGMSAGPRPITPPQAPGIIDQASNMIRQLAASKVLPQLARVGGGITAAVMPGNVGQNYPFPQSGPMRGSEINPSTGRPWTKQELDAYRAQYGG